uniref:PH domain-containing protein n=1 Tax=Electrophorus electricus TaxID=8005 RepID=A0AAY5F3C6_ELEEL
MRLPEGGPLKTWKFRWFTYEENKCQLFYYRTAQDVNPLGRVELYSATFGYPLQSEEGTFHIQTPERTFVLKVYLWSRGLKKTKKSRRRVLVVIFCSFDWLCGCLPCDIAGVPTGGKNNHSCRSFLNKCTFPFLTSLSAK